jgi:serine/threonine protein kinase
MQSIGRGATSEVFATGDGRALKRLHPHLLADPAAVARFLGEAERTRGITHPNVVRVFEVGRDDAGCFLVMEQIAGETLAARLARGTLTEREVRVLGGGLAEGMAAVHDHGIVHRDLKPANIMLAGATPKILDFGIAKSLGEAAFATTTRLGTPAYMAPEQLAAGVVAPPIDVWALGVILFEAAEGRLPFEGFEQGRAPQLLAAAPRATKVSPALARVIASCLERQPARRPRMAELASLLRGEAEPERITQAVVAPPRRSRRWAIATLALATGIAGAGAVALAWPPALERVALPPLPDPDPDPPPPPLPTLPPPADRPVAPAIQPALPAPMVVAPARPVKRAIRATVRRPPPAPGKRAGETLD